MIKPNLYRFLIVIFSTLFLFNSCNKPEEVRPNIIWLFVEDMSPDLSVYGNNIVQTPTLDSLAEQGVYYTRMFSNGTVCTPSRTALFTGVSQNTIGGGEMRLPEELKPNLPEGIVPFPKLLEEGGYTTANIKDGVGYGKFDWEFQLENNPFQKSSWDELGGDKPFFAYFAFRRTHRPFKVDPQYQVDPDKVVVPPFYANNSVSREEFADYYGDIQQLDSEIKEVLDTIRAKGLDKNTIIFFFSDHGRDFLRAKHWLYNTGTQVPFFISRIDGGQLPDNMVSGSSSGNLASLIDVSATTLSLAGIKPPVYFHGKPFLGKYKLPQQEYIFASADRVGDIRYKSRSVRSNDFLYIKNYNTDITVIDSITNFNKAAHAIYHMTKILEERNELDSIQLNLLKPLPEEEFYDLRADSFQIYNQIDNPEFKNEIEKMREGLKAWQEEINDKGMLPETDAERNYFEQYRIETGHKRDKAIRRMRERVEKELGK